ncbi:MAG TPA: isoprenylcysteine carboxylmethyltransferase family protein [Ktedonobacteraceae bacterium]|jgi:protein-S-isoprenylcysteine O-methyltransferase Ste14|nr:isoprenylcysteine carboxylmethyltransferase family protein [Ktedonobacteraceae bacterium]
MLPLIYGLNVYAIIFWVVYVAWFALEMIGAVAQRVKPAAQKQDRGSMVVLLLGLYSGLFLNFFFAGLIQGATITWHRSIFVSIGIVLMVLGVILRHYAIRTLGQYFTREVATRPDQAVVQRGPYKFIRHPAYSGTLLTVLGIGLATANWVSLASIMLLSFIGYSYRVMVEEQALRRALGQPYIEYMHHTKRFIPFVF